MKKKSFIIIFILSLIIIGLYFSANSQINYIKSSLFNIKTSQELNQPNPSTSKYGIVVTTPIITPETQNSQEYQSQF